MKRTVARATLLAAAAAMIVVGCGGDGHREKETTPVRGGTLRVIVPPFPSGISFFPRPWEFLLDPQRDGTLPGLELLRCCLVRTLYSYPGLPADQGGATPRPDLASGPPEVSVDGLTWTIHLRPGVRYAPPYQRVEVTAADFVRGLERAVRLGPTSVFTAGVQAEFGTVVGLGDYARGRTDSISGVETPDSLTLVFRLSRPAGDLTRRLTQPVVSPIPPSPSHPTARFGAAAGHARMYGRYLAASGPYMIAGAGRLDSSTPISRQQPAAGFAANGGSVVLVRNPSWDSRDDPLRPAYPDRIEVRIGGSRDAAARAIDQGAADLVLDNGPPPQAPAAQVARYRARPSLGRVDIEPRNFVRFIGMNLAVPPFDDVHVRRALNFAVDKSALLAIRGGALSGRTTGHVGSDNLEGNLLADTDPYRTPGERGSLPLARREMARSRYDRDRDGRCDGSVCHGVLLLGLTAPTFPRLTAEVVRDLAGIGISARVLAVDPSKSNDFLSPDRHLALQDARGASAAGTDAVDYFGVLTRAGIGSSPDISLLGASSDQLRGLGYSVTKVPTIQARYDACVAQIEAAQAPCWARLDLFLTTQIVPWVPYESENHLQIVPRTVAAYSFDQNIGLPALDRVSLGVAPGDVANAADG